MANQGFGTTIANYTHVGKDVPDDVAFPLIMERLKGRRRITASGCWEYTGYVMQNGYAEICFRGRNTRITRLVHRIHHGETDLDVLHSCDNPICFNPEHLMAGSDKQNVAESVARGRRNTARKPYGKGFPAPKYRTHCIRAHALSGANLYMTPDGRRQCRTCHHAAVKRFKPKPSIALGNNP